MDQRDRRGQIAKRRLGFEADYAAAQPAALAVTAGVSRSAAQVVAA